MRWPSFIEAAIELSRSWLAPSGPPQDEEPVRVVEEDDVDR